MKAERILARLNAFHSLLKYRVERIADARQPRTQELSLSLILTDVDAAIADIRGYLQEPVPDRRRCGACNGTGQSGPINCCQTCNGRGFFEVEARAE